jgi:hypothetical protein
VKATSEQEVTGVLTLRKLIACSRVVLVKLTKFAIASSGGSVVMIAEWQFPGQSDRGK